MGVMLLVASELQHCSVEHGMLTMALYLSLVRRSSVDLPTCIYDHDASHVLQTKSTQPQYPDYVFWYHCLYTQVHFTQRNRAT